MELDYVRGDIIKAKEQVIAHGVNCKGAFGAGVARAIAKRWPGVKEEYKKHASPAALGTIQVVEQGDKFIVNIFSQLTYGRTGRHVDYEAIGKGFAELRDWMERAGIKEAAIPTIGAGLGGGDWSLIVKIIREVCAQSDIKFTVYCI
jgi:O-acetyl-ADP-ribose deacetylase (regulator of RNase III)